MRKSCIGIVSLGVLLLSFTATQNVESAPLTKRVSALEKKSVILNKRVSATNKRVSATNKRVSILNRKVTKGPLRMRALDGQFAKVILGSSLPGRNPMIVGNPGGPALHFIMDNGVIGTNDIMVLRSSGNVGFGTTVPASQLTVTRYIQLSTTAGAVPPAVDCSPPTYGRMKVDEVNSLLYICTAAGWVAK